MRYEIRFAGFGGQGVVLAGFILGKAAALYCGLEAVMTQSYGPEARGGASSANVVLSDTAIDYPFVQTPNLLIALSQEAYTKFRPSADAEALILIDQDLVQPTANDPVYSIPATSIAEELGKRIVANMVMLGFLTEVYKNIPTEAMEKAIKDSVKPKTIELNLAAFSQGYKYGLQAIVSKR
jgi:2-oxoglutarate ferredoxin oxidoreductase subunit gamma